MLLKLTSDLMSDAKEHNESSKRTQHMKWTIWTHAAAVAVAVAPSPKFPFKMSYQ